MTKIYMIELHDFDRDEREGYFVDYTKAKACCEYNNAMYPSNYAEDGDDEFQWKIIEYSLDETDYTSMLKELKLRRCAYRQWELEHKKQSLLSELEIIQAKLNEINIELV